MTSLSRRAFLRVAGGMAAAGLVSRAIPWGSLPIRMSRDGTPFAINSGRSAESVFPQSVASGDPSPTGVILWTRVEAEQIGTVAVEVARDEAFEEILHRAVVPAHQIRPENANTVRIDTDGMMEPDTTYYYRFIHKGTASRTGRCRTLPSPDARVDRVAFGVLTCQNFQNGYFPALGHVAKEDVDFVIHLGDFIYEYDGAKSYNGKHFPGREVRLPSGKPQMESREDLDYVWGLYRSDEHVRSMMERHTVIITWDDHEVTNDRYFDKDAGHHRGDAGFHLTDATALDRFFREGAQAYFDWMPLRVPIDAEAEDPMDIITLYRDFRFGDLVHLWMLDERWYRDAPAAEGLPPTSPEVIGGAGGAREDPDRTMLGDEQREWLAQGLASTPARWKVLGQQVQMSPLAATLPGTSIYLNLDAWDGYEAERQAVAQMLKGVDNGIVLTGDLHTYMAGYVQTGYNDPVGDEKVAVEFMTPGVTSAGLGEIIEEGTGKPVQPGDDEVLEQFVKAGNPHMAMFNSTRHGYSVVEFTRSTARYSAFVVDKATPAVRGNHHLWYIAEVPTGQLKIKERLRRSPSGAPVTTPPLKSATPTRTVGSLAALRKALQDGLTVVSR